MALSPPTVENTAIHHERRKAKWGCCGKNKKNGCWYGCGCFRVTTQNAVTGECPAPAMSVLRNLKERTKAGLSLMCLVSPSWKQPTVFSYSSSSSTPKPSKQPSASSDSHRNQAVQDCISYINSSTTSSSLSSSTVTISTVPPPPPPPPSHSSPISTIQNESTSVIPSTCP